MFRNTAAVLQPFRLAAQAHGLLDDRGKKCPTRGINAPGAARRRAEQVGITVLY